MIDLKAYVFGVIDAWRAAVKRRDIFASPGTRYGDPRRVTSWAADWSPWRALVRLRLDWLALRFDLQPRYEGLSAAARRWRPPC